jgi:hypothetical protein
MLLRNRIQEKIQTRKRKYYFKINIINAFPFASIR